MTGFGRDDARDVTTDYRLLSQLWSSLRRQVGNLLRVSPEFMVECTHGHGGVLD